MNNRETILENALVLFASFGYDATGVQVRELMAKGFAGTVFLTTDDCMRDYAQMSARGVEFVEAPEEQPYGIDCGFRDPSGNHLRLTQLAPAFA